MEVLAQAHGSFCFPELNTRDPKSAARFYGELLGWTLADVAGAAGGCSFWQLHGKDVAGLRRADRGPQGWVPYLSVENADLTAARAQELGAVSRVAPYDTRGVGRMSMLQDPAGGVVGLWQAQEHHGAQLMDEPGTMLWNELLVHDVPAARRFYCSLLGWSTAETRVPTGAYTMFKAGDQSVAGLMAIGPDWGPVAPHWQVFFAVDDCDAGIARTKALGGSLVFGPVDVPNAGRFAVVADAGKAVFAIMRPLGPQQGKPAE